MASQPRTISPNPLDDLSDVDRLRFETMSRDLEGHFDKGRIQQETRTWLAEWTARASYFRDSALRAGNMRVAAQWEVDRRRMAGQRARALVGEG